MTNTTELHQRHAMTRYAKVTEALIDACQANYQAYRRLNTDIPHLTIEDAIHIVAESLEADAFLHNPPDVFRLPNRRYSDWALTTLAEGANALADQMRGQDDVPIETQQDVQSVGWELLERVIASPTISPLLDYGMIYLEVADQYRRNGDARAIDLVHRAIRHDLARGYSQNLLNHLRDLAETHLWLTQMDLGVKLFTTLLQHNLSDIWTYNAIGLTFDIFGLAQLGEATINRGLQLLDQQGDEFELRQQFLEAGEKTTHSSKRGGESRLSPDVLANYQAALTLDFSVGTGQPVPELCEQVVPNLTEVRIKIPKPLPKLPPPPNLVAARGKMGRNDPCWCGSGKKYKHCHDCYT